MGRVRDQMRPFDVVHGFEEAVAHYTGAKYCIAVNSCTNALFLCLMWGQRRGFIPAYSTVTIPRFTYVSVPMQIKHAGLKVNFDDRVWGAEGYYSLKPYHIYDSARWFSSDMFPHIVEHGDGPENLYYVCTSHHWNKTLGIQQGGCILHNDLAAQLWFKRARFDGRTPGVPPKMDHIEQLGWHCYMSPEVAAEGLVRLYHLPLHNDPMPMDDYPNLSRMEIFK